MGAITTISGTGELLSNAVSLGSVRYTIEFRETDGATNAAGRLSAEPRILSRAFKSKCALLLSNRTTMAISLARLDVDHGVAEVHVSGPFF